MNDYTTMDNSRLFNGIPPPGTVDFEELVRFCEAHRVSVLSNLPWVASEIAGTCGFGDMLGLIHRVGGTKVYVPHNASRCSQKLGLQLLEPAHDRLVTNSDANGFIDLPSAWGVFVAIRRAAINVALDSGDPPREIVQRFGVTERYLRKQRQLMRSRQNKDAKAQPSG